MKETLRYNHRCLNYGCFHKWYTPRRDKKALCPNCLTDRKRTYRLLEVDTHNVRLEVGFYVLVLFMVFLVLALR